MAEAEIKKLDKMLEVVQKSIPKERAAHRLYMQTCREAYNNVTEQLFKHLAGQELEHEQKLLAVMELLKKERNRLLKSRT